MPSPEDVRKLYDADYFKNDFSCGVRKGTYLETEATRVEEYRETLAAIGRFKSSGRFLEIGCAAGSLLNYAKRMGFEVEGIDVSEWASAAAAEHFGITVHKGRAVEVKLLEASFDVVFMGDVLEHEADPVSLLSEVRRLIKEDGVAVIKVPTYVNSFYYRTARLFPFSWTLGRLDNRLLRALKLSTDFPAAPPYHLYEYSLDTLERLCARCGLSVADKRNSLLVPEFLAGADAPWPNRAAHLGFKILKAAVGALNLPAGHVMVFAQKRDG